MMKYCPFCGSGLQDEMIYCPECGKKYLGAIKDIQHLNSTGEISNKKCTAQKCYSENATYCQQKQPNVHIEKNIRPKYKPDKYSFWQILDHEYIRDYADYLSLYLKAPYNTIVCSALGLLRIILIILTLVLATGCVCGAVFLILAAIMKGGIYAFAGLTAALIALNTINFFATYKNHSRKIWYFWVCLIASIVGYCWALPICF